MVKKTQKKSLLAKQLQEIEQETDKAKQISKIKQLINQQATEQTLLQTKVGKTEKELEKSLRLLEAAKKAEPTSIV